eukprot:gene113-163_t
MSILIDQLSIPRQHGNKAKDLEAFFTPDEIAAQCAKLLMGFLTKRKFFSLSKAVDVLEPSVGNGRMLKALYRNPSFQQILQKNPHKERNVHFHAIDIVQHTDSQQITLHGKKRVWVTVHEAGFLRYNPPSNYFKAGPKYRVAFGNPPFDKQVEFINKAFEYVEFVAFILGPNINNFKSTAAIRPDCTLYNSVDLGVIKFTGPSGAPRVRTCFQIWCKSETRMRDPRFIDTHMLQQMKYERLSKHKFQFVTDTEIANVAIKKSVTKTPENDIFILPEQKRNARSATCYYILAESSAAFKEAYLQMRNACTSTFIGMNYAAPTVSQANNRAAYENTLNGMSMDDQCTPNGDHNMCQTICYRETASE